MAKNLFLLTLFLSATIAGAADRYWVGGSGNWSDDDNHWATSSGGAAADGNVPTASDAAIIDANSDVASADFTITIDTAAECLSFDSTAAIAGFTLALGANSLTSAGDVNFSESGASGQDMTHESGGTLTVGGDLQTNLLLESSSVSAADLVFTGATPTWRFETSGSTFSPFFNSITLADTSTITMRARSSAVGQDVTVIDNWVAGAGGTDTATITWDTTDTSTNLGMEFQLRAVDVDLDGVFTISNITRFEHENTSSNGGDKRVSGDSRAAITWGGGTVVYDVTGPAAGGPEAFTLNSDITGSTSMRVTIEKQAELRLGRWSITNCEQIRLGDTSGDQAFLYCEDGSITADSHLEFDGTDSTLHVGNGTVTVGGHLETNEGGIINGYAGGTLILNGTSQTPDIYVASTGDDSGAGTVGDPYLTIDKALQVSTATDHIGLGTGDTFALTESGGTFASIGKHDFGGGGADPIVTIPHGTSFTITDDTSFWYETEIKWITDATIQAEFTSSRTSCAAPCAVFFDAIEGTGTRSSNTTVAYDKSDAHHELDYVWDFGDDGSTFTNRSGVDANAAYGSMAAHVFETAGSYIVTLTVRDSDGNTDSATDTITVSDPSWTDIYVDADATGDDDGTTAENAYPTLDAGLADLFSTDGPRRLYVDRGDTFTPTDGSYTGATGPYMITAYGSGAKPIWDVASTSDNGITIGGINDLRIIDQDMDGPANSDGKGVYGQDGQTADHLLVLRCELSGWENGLGTQGNNDYSTLFLVDSTIEDTISYGTRWNYGQHVAILANNYTNTSTGSGGTAEHALRCALTHSVVSHNNFNGGAYAKNIIKFRGWDSESDIRPTDTNEYSVISDNDIRDTETDVGLALYVQIGPHDDNDRNQILENIIFERNLIVADSTYTEANAQDFVLCQSNGPENTIRNNLAVCNTANQSCTGYRIQTRGSNPAPTNNRIYNNNFLLEQVESGDTGYCVRISTGTGHVVYNNILGAEDSLGGTATTIQNSVGATTDTNAMLNGTSEVDGVWTDATAEDFSVNMGAQGRVAAEPTGATALSDIEDAATLIAGLIRDYALVLRPDHPDVPEIGALEFVPSTPSGTSGGPSNKLWTD